MRGFFLVVLLLGMGLASGGCGRGEAADPDDTTAVAHRGKFVVWINARGKVTAESNITVSPPRWWGLKISKLVAKEGDKVEKGDVLLELETENLDDRIRDATRDIRSSEGALESARANLRAETDRLQTAVNKAVEDIGNAAKAVAEIKRLPLETDLRNAQIDRDTRAKGAEQAGIRYENMKTLYDRGSGVSLQQLEQRELEHRGAVTDYQRASLTYEVVKAGATQATVRDAQIAVELAELALKQAERTRDLTVAQLEESAKKAEGYLNMNRQNLVRLERVRSALAIRAPIAGTVFYSELWTQEGQEKIKEGMEVRPWDRLMELPDTTRMQIGVEVEEQDIGNVQTGQFARIALDAYRQKKLTGKVTKIGQITKRKGGREMGRSDSDREDLGTKVLDVIVTFEEQDPLIRTGLNGRAEIRTQQEAEGLLVPLKAVFNVDGRDVVYRVKDGGRVETPVVVGGRSDTDALILSGLTEGDRLSLVSPRPGPAGGKDEK